MKLFDDILKLYSYSQRPESATFIGIHSRRVVAITVNNISVLTGIRFATNQN